MPTLTFSQNTENKKIEYDYGIAKLERAYDATNKLECVTLIVEHHFPNQTTLRAMADIFVTHGIINKAEQSIMYSHYSPIGRVSLSKREGVSLDANIDHDGKVEFNFRGENLYNLRCKLTNWLNKCVSKDYSSVPKRAKL